MENPGIYYILSCIRSWKRLRCSFYSALLPQGMENVYMPDDLGPFLASLCWRQLLNGITCTSLGFLNTFKFLVWLVLLHNMLARASLGKQAGRKLLSEADRREVVSEVPWLWAGADELTHRWVASTTTWHILVHIPRETQAWAYRRGFNLCPEDRKKHFLITCAGRTN